MAKIQVQGIGMYTDDTLKKTILRLAKDLNKNAKSGNWNKASENGIRALGRMWGAYQEWARNNESVNEGEKKAIDQVYTKFYKAFIDFTNASTDLAKQSTKISGDKTDQKIILKNFKKYVIPFIGLIQSWNQGKQKNPHIDESDLGLTYKKGKTIKVTHNKSGREIIIIDKPNVRKEYEKIGYYVESVNEKIRPAVKKLLKQKGYSPIFQAIDNSKRQFKQMRYSRGEIQDTLIDMFGDEDPKILQKIKESVNEDVDKYGNIHAKTKKELKQGMAKAIKIILAGKVPKFEIINGQTGEMICWSEKKNEYTWQPSAIPDAERELK